MKSLPIKDDEQIRAILNGSVRELLSQYVENPPRYDFKPYLSVNRDAVIRFLVNHPAEAESYFRKHSNTVMLHDAERLYKEGDAYCVASMYRGRPRAIRPFQSLAQAVAEHVLVSYGMY